MFRSHRKMTEATRRKLQVRILPEPMPFANVVAAIFERINFPSYEQDYEQDID